MDHRQIWFAPITPPATMQFDVFPNPIPAARRAYPYVTVMQSDFAETGRDVLVAFLAPRALLPQAAGRLMPQIQVGDCDYLLLVPSLTSIRAKDLKDSIGSIDAYRTPIVNALDWLFLGI